MVYYKLIRDGKIFQVATSDDNRKHQEKHNILLQCGSSEAEYIQVGGNLYRDNWMKPVKTDFFSFEIDEIRSISEDEYNIILKTIEKGEELEVPPLFPEEIAEETLEEPEDLSISEPTVEFVREAKIKEMSLACNKAITNGFDVKLSDGNEHHFSLTLYDQTNLTEARMKILAGEEEIPYHADGEDSTLFSTDDMTEIIKAADEHKTYHLAYFNSMKTWINALKKVTTIQTIAYGDEIPKKYQSALLKKLLG